MPRVSKSNFVVCKATTFVSFSMDVSDTEYRDSLQDYTFFLPFPQACDWGILHEPKAKQEYMERTGVTIQERGVFLSDSGLLCGSPDGMVANDFIIKVKCSYSARTKTNLQAAERKDFFLELDEVTGLLKLKQPHNYWHQIQGNLHLTGVNSCHLVVWTPLDLVILLIHKDPAWANNINILETFYKDCFLPKILSEMSEM